MLRTVRKDRKIKKIGKKPYRAKTLNLSDVNEGIRYNDVYLNGGQITVNIY